MKTFESQIANNPFALTPLLLKRNGFLTRVVAGWCKTSADIVEHLRNDLDVRINSRLCTKSCPAELVSRRWDEVMRLGLFQLGDVRSAERAQVDVASGYAWGTEDSKTFIYDQYEKGLRELLEHLALDVLQIYQREADDIITRYALVVGRMDPGGGNLQLPRLVARRTDDAFVSLQNMIRRMLSESIVAPNLAKPTASASVRDKTLKKAAKQMAKTVLERLLDASGQDFRWLDDYLERRRSLRMYLQRSLGQATPDGNSEVIRLRAREAAREWLKLADQTHGQEELEPASSGTAMESELRASIFMRLKKLDEVRQRREEAGADAVVIALERLMDATLFLMRAELAKDVIEANLAPTSPTCARAEDVRRAARILDQSLSLVAQFAGESGWPEDYWRHTFESTRADAFKIFFVPRRDAKNQHDADRWDEASAR